MRLLLILVSAARLFSQQPEDVLERARTRLADAAAATPRYTCTQTVDRSYFRETRQTARTCDSIVANRRHGRSKPALVATDRLRFDVEVTDGGYEIYAWPGASRIDNQKVEAMAGGGPLGSGPFGPFLVDIFANPRVEFQFLGEKPIGGSRRYEYRYRVPAEASHYRVQAGVTWSVTGYDGTFQVEPVSAVLKQLDVRTLELPPNTTACEAETAMDFEPLRIGAGEYLVPLQTMLTVIGRDAGVTENSTVYTECREFRGEAVVRFGDASPPADAIEGPAVVPRSHGLPPGLPMVLALDSEIDTDHAAAGDTVQAKLAKPLVDPTTKRVLAPAGSLLRGRITHLEHHIEGEKYFLVGLSFETLDTAGGAQPLAIILDSAHQVQDSRALSERGVVTSESHSGFHGGGTLVFGTGKPHYVVPRGYLSKWITVGR